MRALLDNDFFAKTDAAGLLQSVLVAFGLTLPDCACLASLAPKLRRGKWARELGAAAVALEATAAGITHVPDAPAATLAKVQGVRDIDPGEAVLFALAAGSDSLLLFTGDKRALRAVAGIPEIRTELAGRIVTLEMAMLLVCRAVGVRKVKAALAASPVKDNALTCILGAGPDEEVFKAFKSYQESLAAEVGSDLLWAPDDGE